MKKYFTKTGLILIGLIAITSCASSTSSSPVAQVKKKANDVRTVATTTRKAAPKKTTAKKQTTSSYARKIGTDKHGMPTYSDSSRTRYVRATAYSHKENEPGAPGRKSAAMTTLKFGSTRSAAADWSRLPVGTKFKISSSPGITYVIDDYGSALVGTNTIDMFFPTLSQMNRWGTRKVTIQITQMGSWAHSARLLKGRLHAPHCRKMYNAITKKYGKNIANQ